MKIITITILLMLGVFIDESITIYACNERGEFYTIINGNYTCEKVNK